MALGEDSDYSHYKHVDDTEELLEKQPWARSNVSSVSAPKCAACQGRLPWRGVSWRFGCALLFSVLIMAVLYSYAGRERLDTWDRRLFNLLTILLSSLVSLSLGSLLGLLGSVLRWPLLARQDNTPRNVDLILGMPNPTGSLKLIMKHCRNREWSVTTLVVLVYLLLNIIGRLSVAIFGLTYDLNENAGVEYPVMLTDFGAGQWAQLGTPDRDLGQMINFALTGLTVVDTKYNLSDPSTFNMKNISGQGLDRSVDGDTVTYAYPLREYRGLDEYSSSDRVVYSSSSCVGRNFIDGWVYEKGKLVGNLLKGVESSSPEFLHILDGIYTFYGPATDYIWAKNWDYDHLANPTSCATSYLHHEIYPSYKGGYVRNATLFECTTCLKGRNGNPSLDSDLFFNFTSANVSYAAGILLNFGSFDRIYQFSLGGLSAKEYESQEHAKHFINGLTAMTYDEFGEKWYSKPVSTEYELHTAHLAARLPILAIMGAERQLPRVTREQGASEKPFIVTSLEVKWPRAIGVLVAILTGQLLAVGVVFYASRGVPVRDHDSFLSLARLLRTAMNTVEGRSAHCGEDLAKSIQEPLRYGTRRVPGKTGEEREVDLWNDVDDIFPKGKKYH